MEFLFYFGIALVLVALDAISCDCVDRRCCLWRSILLLVIWPLTSLLLIVGVVRKQKRSARGKRNTPG